MKKLKLSVAVVAIVGLVTTNLTAGAYVPGIDPPAELTCYTTYDPGTTTFVNCWMCGQEVGSNLRDPGKCTPGGF